MHGATTCLPSYLASLLLILHRCTSYNILQYNVHTLLHCFLSDYYQLLAFLLGGWFIIHYDKQANKYDQNCYNILPWVRRCCFCFSKRICIFRYNFMSQGINFSMASRTFGAIVEDVSLPEYNFIRCGLLLDSEEDEDEEEEEDDDEEEECDDDFDNKGSGICIHGNQYFIICFDSSHSSSIPTTQWFTLAMAFSCFSSATLPGMGMSPFSSMMS